MVHGQPASSRAYLRLSAGLVLLAIVTTAVHWPALSARAVGADDSEYLLDNWRVQHPSVGAAWQFLAEIRPTTVHGYYQPLTMVSLMLDTALGGSPADLRPYHRTSLVLHAANTVLVAALLWMLFDSIPAALLAALLFGVHPMTVEPIPWVGERKTLLASFFSLVSLVCYVRYARRGAWWVFAAAGIAYLLALLSKPTSTMLPVAMLLMDVWPLRRFSVRSLLEKAPLLAVGLVSAVVTYVSQRDTLAATLPGDPGSRHPLLIVAHNVVFYLYKVIWPVPLWPHYPIPHPMNLSHPMVVAGLIGTIVLILLLALSLRWTRALAVSALVSFVLLFPAMGVVGFTNVIASDKFMYLPAVGLLLIVAWALRSVWLRPSRTAAGVLTAVLLLVSSAYALRTRDQYRHWANTEALCLHTLRFAPDAAVPLNAWGNELLRQGRVEEAIQQYHKAIQLEPANANFRYNLANVYAGLGQDAAAAELYRGALSIRPHFPEALTNLAGVLTRMGHDAEALDYYEQAIRLKPQSWAARFSYGLALAKVGRPDDAIRELEEANRLQPKPQTHRLIAALHARQGRQQDADRHMQEAVRLESASGARTPGSP